MNENSHHIVCPRCAHKNEFDVRYCGACGVAIIPEDTSTALLQYAIVTTHMDRPDGPFTLSRAEIRLETAMKIRYNPKPMIRAFLIRFRPTSPIADTLLVELFVPIRHDGFVNFDLDMGPRTIAIGAFEP